MPILISVLENWDWLCLQPKFFLIQGCGEVPVPLFQHAAYGQPHHKEGSIRSDFVDDLILRDEERIIHGQRSNTSNRNPVRPVINPVLWTTKHVTLDAGSVKCLLC